MNHSDYDSTMAGILAGMDALIAVHTDRRLELIPAEVELLRGWADQLRQSCRRESPEHMMEKEHPDWLERDAIKTGSQEARKPDDFKCPFYKQRRT